MCPDECKSAIGGLQYNNIGIGKVVGGFDGFVLASKANRHKILDYA